MREKTIAMLERLLDEPSLTAEEKYIVSGSYKVLTAGKPNINEMSWVEIHELTGIGVTRSKNIADHPRRLKSRKNLLEVRGIGPETANRIAEKVRFV